MNSLLDIFLSEEVTIFTTETLSVQLDSGELTEIPHILEGVFVDYNANWILLEKKEGVSVINIDKVVDITKIDEAAVMLDDPDRPDRSEMN